MHEVDIEVVSMIIKKILKKLKEFEQEKLIYKLQFELQKTNLKLSKNVEIYQTLSAYMLVRQNIKYWERSKGKISKTGRLPSILRN